MFLAWHLWILNLRLLWTRLRLFDFFRSGLGLNRWVIHCRFLFVGAIHSIKKFSNLIFPSEVLVQIGVIHNELVLINVLLLWLVLRRLSSVRHI